MVKLRIASRGRCRSSIFLPSYRVILMPASTVNSTTVSTKGQVILPKAIRDQRRWTPGTRLVVEDTPEGVLLKAAPLFPPTRIEDVFGMLAYKGSPKTVEEMDAGIEAEVRARHARGRY